jgi:hypothetical protein
VTIGLDRFAYSFSHAIVRVGGRQFVGLKNVTATQDLAEEAVYGTSVHPIGRSVGQIQMGQGSLTFSDFGEGSDFFESLGSQPLLSIWDLDYSLVRDDGAVKSIACQACRLTGQGIEHESGPGALEIAYPFSFLRMKVNNIDGALDAKQLINAAIDIAQNIF